MQASRAGSTLELVVDEQQMHNMSQIDLNITYALAKWTKPIQLSQSSAQRANGSASQQGGQSGIGISLEDLKRWPARFWHSFSSQLDEAKAKSETRTQYALAIVQAFSGLAIWLGCFLCTIIVPIILLFLGLLNLDDCKDSPTLPYYVFTVGFVMTASNLFNLALALDLPILANHRLLVCDIKNIIASILNIIFNCIVAFFYIITAYKVLRLYFGYRSGADNSSNANNQEGATPSANEELGTTPLEHMRPDCNLSLFNLTFWFVMLTLGSLVLISLTSSLLFLYNRHRLAIMRGSTPRTHAHPGYAPSGSQPSSSPNLT